MATVDVSLLLQVAAPVVGAIGCYVGVRIAQARVETRLDDIVRKVDRIEGRGDIHTGDISRLREEVSVARTQILSLHQEIGAVREEQGEARDFANATRADVTTALQSIAVLQAKTGITPAKGRYGSSGQGGGE